MPEKLTYAAAGVDLEAADEVVSRIGKLAKSTYTQMSSPELDRFPVSFAST